MLNFQAVFKRSVAGCAVAAVVAVLACSGQAGPPAGTAPEAPAETITVSGAGGTSAVLLELSKHYTELYGGVEFNFMEGSGSGGGVKGVNARVLDLGAMSRPPKESELAGGLKFLSFAEERVAIVTSPDIVLPGLTASQIRSIFSGEVKNWSELGGVDAPISVLVRDEDDSNTRIFRQGIFGDGDFSPAAVVLTSEKDTKSALSQSTRAVGYLAYSGVLRENLPVNTVSIDGSHPANTESSYPMAPRTLGVAYLSENESKMRHFLDFLTGSVAKDVLAVYGLKAKD